MKAILPLVLAAAALCAASPASADVMSYCQAYARDVANARLSGNSILTGISKPVAASTWQGTYDAALADCLATYSPPADARPINRVVKKKKSKPAAAAPSQAAPVLEPGSQAWNDYCAKKYASFDPKTGFYTGKSGKKRRCLVTNP